jgi:hypothetical protein
VSLPTFINMFKTWVLEKGYDYLAHRPKRTTLRQSLPQRVLMEKAYIIGPLGHWRTCIVGPRGRHWRTRVPK